MLKIKNITKQYITGDLKQVALDNISLNLRDSEFVAILGPSGSGKTTLLNIIGGLDRYDSGDLIINGISTKQYKDRDWDSYRNHTIGFVFQSYNLIMHLSILANVELALTISGVSKSERKQRAIDALKQVGLEKHIYKKPNQLSGGQMQRVAIARALVNDPDILLADEPTGALDSETSVQVMDLLKEVAKDRLVVMVTHNPELAKSYASRIVQVKDGKIIDDSNPYNLDEKDLPEVKYKNMGKSSMSFLTALVLSFNNLKTKKARTLLTSFAGSIGIIGIALILSLSNGVSNYISDIQKDTMSSYPISIEAETIDLTSVMGENQSLVTDDVDHKKDGVYSNSRDLEMASTMTTNITKNNLTEFKKYLEDPKSEINEFVGENGIVYTYDTKFGVYTKDPNGELVNTDGSTLDDNSNDNSSMMTNTTRSNFQELMSGKKDDSVSKVLKDNYDVVYGKWPNEYDEIVLVLDKNNEISSTVLYQLGILPASEYKDVMNKINNGETVSFENQKWSYEDICSKEFYLIPDSATYIKNGNGLYSSIKDDMTKMEGLLDNAVKLKITGVVRPNNDDTSTLINRNIGYTKALTDYIIDYTNNSEVVKAQEASKEINITNGMTFSPSDDSARIEDTKKYLSNLGISEKARFCQEILMTSPNRNANVQNMSEVQLAATLDNYLENPDDEVLLEIYNSYISTGTYDDNMEMFGLINYDAPSAINIYTDSFEDKDEISRCINDYNETVSEENQITYTDYVGLLMSSVTTIINVISYVLIAFVGVSLVVSSIMIGIITYISVLERTKEIGILRAIGASKRNISQVFNAETFIIGLCSGVLGILICLIVLVPANQIIHSLVGSTDVNAVLPLVSAVVLIVLSVLLTLLGGIIPSKKAAKKDPVTALRTE